MQNQFEQYIKKILARAESADALRSISNNGHGVFSAVDSILLESELEAMFAPPSHLVTDKRQSVLQKLSRLESELIVRGVKDTDSDMIIVKLCQKYVNEGYGITIDIADLLNRIHKSYGK